MLNPIIKEKNIILIQGALTQETVDRHWKEVKASFTQEPFLYVDLGRVTQSDTASLAFLLALVREAKQHDVSITFLQMPSQLQALATVNGVLAFLPLSS